MSTSSSNSFSSVLSVNPYKDTYCSGVSSFLTETKSPAYAKDQFVISYLNTRDFITAQIEISKNIPEEDLYDAINSKAYDELALDQAIEYHIHSIETFDTLDEENRHFHVFIVDPNDLQERFENVIEKVKYIDVIIPAPLLIKSLYSKELIENSDVHCFIYIQENDASLTIYRNQDFVYTKSLKFSLIDLHERFCDLYGERIPYDDFLDFYQNADLKTTQSDYKEYFIKLYKELISNINDILTYAKRAFEIDKLEHIYIGSQEKTKTELYEILEFELNIPSSPFEFNYGFELSENYYVDQMHALMQLYTLLPSDEKYECNFTVYKRPPKFIKRESGKLIILILAVFALAFAYPITYWVLTYAQQLQKDLLRQEFKEVHNLKITREAMIRSRQADKQKALKLLEAEKKEYIEKKNTLMKIHKVKVDYPMKAKLLALFTKDLNKFNVNIEEAFYTEKDEKQTLSMHLVAPTDRQITKLVEYITKIHEGKYRFDLNEIKYDDKFKTYLAELKVTLL
ncbi:MAG: hypothetical protein ABGW85_04260 [Sulfurimonas sp.]